MLLRMVLCLSIGLLYYNNMYIIDNKDYNYAQNK